jgi:hypothetical protein
VLAHSDTAPALSDRLTQLGETPEAHQLSDEALQNSDRAPDAGLSDEPTGTHFHNP